MNQSKSIKTALVSVFNKEPFKPVIEELIKLNVCIYSTGGTFDFIRSLGGNVEKVEDLTGYPSILGGRVKTLHPKVFGGILGRRHVEADRSEMEKFSIPVIDLVIVDLYPFQDTVLSGASEEDIIEKIDIGGISLIRAAAKNYREVLVVASQKETAPLLQILRQSSGTTEIAQRKLFSSKAFSISSDYDHQIAKYINGDVEGFKTEANPTKILRYGENPNQKGFFHGDIDQYLDKIHGKELSYNNLLDVDAAIGLISEFDEPTVAIIKHNNACGVASREKLDEAWKAALIADPLSAFGGVIISNRTIDSDSAALINDIFFELIIAPGYEPAALEILQQRKNRIILINRLTNFLSHSFRSLLNGVIEQERDQRVAGPDDIHIATTKSPSVTELEDLFFAGKIVKHTRSNAIVLASGKQMLGSGMGLTSRIDALQHAIKKSKSAEFQLNGAVMASDAFFPFPDCVEIAGKEGIKAVIQPGGSVRDQESINYCNNHEMSMIFTGIRHFRH